MRVWGELRLAGASVSGEGEGPLVSVHSNLQCLQSPCVTNINNNTLTQREMLSSSDTWQRLSTSWTSSSYFTSSVMSPSSHVSPSSLLAEMITWSRRGYLASITLTPSDASGSGCKEWQRGWGILCQGDYMRHETLDWLLFHHYLQDGRRKRTLSSCIYPVSGEATI